MKRDNAYERVSVFLSQRENNVKLSVNISIFFQMKDLYDDVYKQSVREVNVVKKSYIIRYSSDRILFWLHHNIISFTLYNILLNYMQKCSFHTPELNVLKKLSQKIYFTLNNYCLYTTLTQLVIIAPPPPPSLLYGFPMTNISTRQRGNSENIF